MYFTEQGDDNIWEITVRERETTLVAFDADRNRQGKKVRRAPQLAAKKLDMFLFNRKLQGVIKGT